jgi:molybdate transport system substrate-binding protein
MTTFFSGLVLACALLGARGIHAEELPLAPVQLSVLSARGFLAAMQLVAPAYEEATGVHIRLQEAPSMGRSPEAIPNRLARRESVDIVLMEDAALSRLINQSEVQKHSRVELGKSFIAMAVRQGAVKPDIGTMKAFRSALLDAQSLAYSDSSSGLYLAHLLFPRMKLAVQLKAKSRTVTGESVGAVVARGEAQLGFQQLSELMRVPGIVIVGLIPDSVQKMTLYSAGIISHSAHPSESAALVKYLASPHAHDAIERSGLIPVH